MSELEVLARRKKKRKKKKKKKKKPQAPGGGSGGGSPTPTGHALRHAEWVDNGDGSNTLRVTYTYHDTPQPQPPDPRRPIPAAVPETNAAPAAFGTYSGPFGRLQAKRLLDRAGFGPRPGQAEQLASMGLVAAVHSLTRPQGSAVLQGPSPTDGDGNAISPTDAWGHDVLWWLDRMVRSNQPFIERISLIWHDWFATSRAGVDNAQHMINQSNLFRTHGLGSFENLVLLVTQDPAMLTWLNGIQNHRWAPNENYARELLELFTLGADRGAYTENDIREMARALTGWRADWSDTLGLHNFRFHSPWHDTGNKTIFGQTANWNWNDSCVLPVRQPLHPSFFVTKMWSYFVPTAPSASTRQALENIYTQNNYAIRPVVEAILMHPDFYQGPVMVKPPVVFLASMLRARSRSINTDSWSWLLEGMGQVPFWPPNVAGWREDRWLDTSSTRAYWDAVSYLRHPEEWDPWDDDNPYDAAEDPQDAVISALSYWNFPPLPDRYRSELLDFANNAFPTSLASWQHAPYRAMRQNALRHLLALNPAFVTC